MNPERHQPGDFSVVIGAEDECAVLELHGELDAATAPGLADYLDAVITQHSGGAVLDLADLDFMDSTGLRVLLDAHARLRAAGRGLVLRSPPPLVRKTLAVSGVSNVIAVEGLPAQG